MTSLRRGRYTFISLIVFGLVAIGLAVAQDRTPAQQPEAEKPAPPPPADEQQPVMARVIEVHGDVKYAPLDSREYKVCKLDDEYPARTKIITGVRSSIKLQIGEEEPYTCLLVEAVGKTILSEAYKTKDTKKVRVGVGYGRIRAGVAEGGLKSDFTVDSPVATLSKRGTWGFTLFYERDTDFFQIGLTDRGLVEAINRLSKEKRTINPKELVTSAMLAWLDQAQFDRNVAIPDILGQGDIGVAFNRIQQSGLGVLSPGGGQQVLLDLSNPHARAGFAELVRQGMTGALLTPTPTPTHRPEGFFGTGRGDELIEVMIDSNNTLVQKGCARPGLYKFRRAALESWMRNYRPQP